MKIIANYNNKGGVGKTTTTKTMAKYLASENKKVLLIDMDPQGNLTSQFKSKSKAEFENSINDLLLTTISLNECIYSTEINNIHIVPSNINLLKANNQMLLESINKTPTTRLKNKINESQVDYDYILIDAPPTMDLLVSNALAISDEVVIPIQADNYSLDGINLLLEKINEIKLEYNNKLRISSIFLNRYKRSKVHNEVYETLKYILPQMSKTYIGDYAIVSRDTFEENTKIEQHKVSQQFKNLFEEMDI